MYLQLLFVCSPLPYIFLFTVYVLPVHRVLPNDDNGKDEQGAKRQSSLKVELS